VQIDMYTYDTAFHAILSKHPTNRRFDSLSGSWLELLIIFNASDREFGECRL
jgi:hypothetical protein